MLPSQRQPYIMFIIYRQKTYVWLLGKQSLFKFKPTTWLPRKPFYWNHFWKSAPIQNSTNYCAKFQFYIRPCSCCRGNNVCGDKHLWNQILGMMVMAPGETFISNNRGGSTKWKCLKILDTFQNASPFSKLLINTVPLNIEHFKN